MGIVVNILLDSFSVVTVTASASWFNGDISSIIAGIGGWQVVANMGGGMFSDGRALDIIRPSKPVDNAFIESFNGSFRDECLKVN